MFITNTITKNILEGIIKNNFKNFGIFSTSNLLDSLKLLGFFYATNSGISVNIEELKTPEVKKTVLENALKDSVRINEKWRAGRISEVERFDNIIDKWSLTTDILKDRIVDYFQKFDPVNNLYVMAFSGARGNMSQVRQLIGMRGLMSDQNGKIISLPIQTNFREGLSCIDYIISSYGARKGLVDTALKTADSGYLTRRLIYVAQNLIIRKIDCGSNKGILIYYDNKTDIKDIIGRVLISTTSLNTYKVSNKFKNIQLNEETLKTFCNNSIILNIRSPLMCLIKNSICQNCYGWDLSKKKLINLGEAVGIIAAHSIGEPGTQLTMRTFHTGGIFTGELLEQILAPISGKLDFSSIIEKKYIFRTNHGQLVNKISREIILNVKNWKGNIKSINLNSGSLLYTIHSKYVKKGDLIAEYVKKSNFLSLSKFVPIYSSFSGELYFEKNKKILRNLKLKLKRKKLLWLKSGKIFILPIETFFNYNNNTKENKSFAFLNFISPYEGFLFFNNSNLFILSNRKKYSINIENLKFLKSNYKIRLIFLIKNYQYIDKYTLIGKYIFQPFISVRIFAIKKYLIDKEFSSVFFLITSLDIWKFNEDQNFNFIPYIQNKGLNIGHILNISVEAKIAGFLLKKYGKILLFQKAYSIHLDKKTYIKHRHGNYVAKKELMLTLLSSIQETQDIVQGLPKINNLFEARTPEKNKVSTLAIQPGVYVKSLIWHEIKEINIDQELIFVNYKALLKPFLKKNNFQKQLKYIELIQTKYSFKNNIIYNNDIWFVTQLPKNLKLIKSLKFEGGFMFKKDNNILSILSRKPKKFKSLLWYLPFMKKKTQELAIKDKSVLNMLNKNENYIGLKEKWEFHNGIINNFDYNLIEKNKKISKIKSLSKVISKYVYLLNKKNSNYMSDFIIQIDKNSFFYLKKNCLFKEYNTDLNCLDKPNIYSFIDIGEPISPGIINPRDLLEILFNYHYRLDGILIGIIKCLNKFQLIIINSIQSLYQSQDVIISSKHLEIVIRQMTNNVTIINGKNTPYIPGEIIPLALILEILKVIKNNRKVEIIHFQPIFLSSISSSLNKNSFLATSSFQHTKYMLSKASIYGKTDWLVGLKECIICGNNIPSGTTFLKNTYNLDTIYIFKK